MNIWLKDAFTQLFKTQTKRDGKLRLTHLAFRRMEEYKLQTGDLENAFRFGTEVKEGMIIQRFQTHHIGLTCKETEKPDEYVIITCWKR